MLTVDELRSTLRSGPDANPLATRRKAEQAWVRAHPGPMLYGPSPGKLPEVRGLPEPARRINAALLWILEHELTAQSQKNADATRLTGIAASPGVYRGRVRVIRCGSEIDKLRAGEVLVCPITTAAWTMVFRRAGALITDAGSALSHPAIVAREYGLPAVVATMNATSTLIDGEEVVVDGNRGTVQRVR